MREISQCGPCGVGQLRRGEDLSWEAGKGSLPWDQEMGVDVEGAQTIVPNPLFPFAASTSSEDIVIEEFARQEPGGREESQEALAAEGDEGS